MAPGASSNGNAGAGCAGNVPGGSPGRIISLFLSDPASYEGGAPIVEESYGERAIKLPAGELILYPSTTLHRVEPVTVGVRLAAVGWLRSHVRDAERREILFDLKTALRQLHAEQGKSGVFDLLVKTRTNLLRRWAED